MEAGNIREEETQGESLIGSIVRWAGVWLVISVVLGIYGGVFRSSPRHLSAGMTWVNEGDGASSTFYVLRDGPHLILELNPHSQKWWLLLFTAFAVGLMYMCSQGIRGRLKNRRGQLLSGAGQAFSALGMGAMAAFILWFGAVKMLQQETLDLDPANDTVTLDDAYLAPFKQVTGFRAYTTRGSKGSTNYHIVLETAGRPPIEIGGGNAHDDVDQAAAYLDAYLAEVHQQAPIGP